MPLSKQPFPLQLGQGLDTKSDPKTVVPGRLLELENGTFDRVGSIRKRHGFDRVSSDILGGTAVASADGLATFRDELLLFGDGHMYARSDLGWVDRGPVVSCALTTSQVIRNTYQQKNPDSATTGGLTLTAWEDSRGGVRYSVTDGTTTFVADGEVSATGSRPRVAVWQDEFAIFWSNANNIFYRRVSPETPTDLGVAVNPASTLDPAAPYWGVINAGAYLFIVGVEMSGDISHWQISSAWAAAATSTPIDAAHTGTSPALWLDPSGNVVIAQGESGAQWIAVMSSIGVVIAAPTTIAGKPLGDYITGVAISDSEGVVFFDSSGVTYSVRYYVSGSTVTGGTVTLVANGARPCADPFVRGDTAYCPCTWESALQSTTFVLSETGACIARTEPGLGGGHRDNGTVATLTDYAWPSTVKTAVFYDGGVAHSRTGIELVSLSFPTSIESAELGGNLLVSGAVLQAYDGVSLTESGFLLFPESVVAVAAGSGGSIDAGAHQWRVVYEWTDAQGQIHRSAPSAAVSVTTAASDEVTLTIPTLRVTSKQDVRIAIFRTLASGSVFYRLDTMTAPTLNDPTADSVTYVDNDSDSSISDHEVLYTDGTSGQELENIPPGACSLITTHRSRAFVKTAPNRVSFSKLTLDGEPPAFNDGLYLTPDGRGGEITALAGMDDKLIIFKQRAVFAVAGDGPSNTGAGDYAEPVLVTSDVGCDEPRSVVLTNAGLMFHTTKGIYLLDRSLAVTYIGAPVEAYNDLTITSALVVPGNNQVRFTTSGTVTTENGETRTNLVLVYDYLMNQWSTFTRIAAVDAVVSGGVYTWATSRGRVYQEGTGYTDDGQTIKLRLVTSWLSLGQIQGFQRIYRVMILGDYRGSHSLRVRLGYDFRPEYTFDETVGVTGPGTWGSDSAWGTGAVWGGAWPTEWWRVSPQRQKCSSIRISVEDVDSTGEGLAITSIVLLAGVKAGVNKMSASRSF